MLLRGAIGPPTSHSDEKTVLIITADDYGYGPGVNRGVLEAASAGAIDSVSAMVTRTACDPGPLLATGVEIGLHFELEIPPGRATDADRAAGLDALNAQMTCFENLFGTAPAYLDGHHHAHAALGLAATIGRAARARGLSVRSVEPRHRRLLRCMGVPTPDLLIGRTEESDPPRPAELDSLPAGTTEWMVHPGYRDPASGSAFDAGREDDLRLLLSEPSPHAEGGATVTRATHREALT